MIIYNVFSKILLIDIFNLFYIKNQNVLLILILNNEN